MFHLASAHTTVASGRRCEDRVDIFELPDRTVIVVADGAGGTEAGDVAAEAVVQGVERALSVTNSANDWAAVLSTLDRQILAGQSTAVVVDIRPYGIAGASVGDSRAWIVSENQITDLTKGQRRKPLLGSRSAVPVAFTYQPLDGTLLAATDGFFNYAKRADISRLIAENALADIPQACVDLVRLPSGDLWDDVGIVAVRSETPSTEIC